MRHTLLFLLTIAFAAIALRAEAAVVRSGFNVSSLAANDDLSTGLTSLGFGANFFGTTYTDAFLNNNGNMSFGGPLNTFTPFGLSGPTTRPIIAPFFADVDTRGSGSDLMRFGSGTVGGRNAFGVTWAGVGYFSSRTDKLNNFQMVLVERFDTGAGNFDIEFNYDRVQWETGGNSGGSGGLGGNSARVGYSNGTGTPGSFFELPGSGVNGAFLDSSGGLNRLISNSLGVSIDRGSLTGQYVFQARGGILVSPEPEPTATVPEPISISMWTGLSLIGLVAARRRRTRRKGHETKGARDERGQRRSY